MTGRFPSGHLKYARACNSDCCFDDVFDDGLVADSLLATTYRTNAGSEHSLTAHRLNLLRAELLARMVPLRAHGLTTVLDYSDHSQDEVDSDFDQQSRACDSRRKKQITQRGKLHGSFHALRAPAVNSHMVRRFRFPPIADRSTQKFIALVI
jgi:hypothetical protein